MGAYDGAESCDLIGLFLLDQIANRIKDINAGLYRDDGLAVVESTPRNNEKLRQKIISIMGEFGLKITSLANQKVVEFLDVKLDLENESYGPFIKPGDKPIYVNSESNHPPAILKNIPLAVNRRLSNISSSKEIFDRAAPVFQNELNRAGYSHKLEFVKDIPEPKRKRKKPEIWFNPPYSMNVKTNIGRKFLRLVDKHFPRGSLLHPLFSRSKLKIGYRCMPNMGQKINNHNSKMLTEKKEELKCNCRNKEECPLPGKCQIDKVVYRATVTTNNKTETYVGLTAGNFKKRWSKHKTDFSYSDKRNSTTLASYIWKLKDDNVAHQVEFEIVCRAAPFSPVSGRCDLCTAEKYEIMFNRGKATLNSRHEIFSACRHKWSNLLVKKARIRRPAGT